MRWLWVVLGFTFLAVGAIGLILPLWPTTIFWIVAVFCLAESHPKVRDWIYGRPGIGPIIRDFVERGEVSRKSKAAAISGMSLAGLISGWFLRESWVAVTALVVSLLIGVVFVATRRTPEPED